MLPKPLQLIDEVRTRMLALVWQYSGGAVAQLGARLDGIEEVVGSNPIGSTNFKLFPNDFVPRSHSLKSTFPEQSVGHLS